MRRKYKLIKEYPLSPGVGYITEEDEFTYIKDYPEFWELQPNIIDSKVEILTLEISNNTGVWSGTNALYTEPGQIKNYPTAQYWNITKVKRLCDDKIFKVGDITSNGNKIEKFYILENGDCNVNISLKNDDGGVTDLLENL